MKTHHPSFDELFDAMRRRDATYDGLAFVCVRTTHIFCRPSCPARKPLRKNVMFHHSVRDCLLDGFRPCKRCEPLADGGPSGEWLPRLLDRIESAPADRISDADLEQLGVNPHRVRRYFQRNFGMTFQAYHRARRMGLALEALSLGQDALTVALDHGFESQSGFRDAFHRVFGTTPGNSGALESIKLCRIDTPIGPLVAGAIDRGVCLVEFADRRALARQMETLCRRLRAVAVPGRNEHLEQLRMELNQYFNGERAAFEVPTVVPGTEFQQAVWRQLSEIPYGETRSYRWMAEQIGRPGAHRAVGRANGDNRLAILIPCHRVTAADGQLSGYGGGVWRKQHLLELERRR